MLGAMLILDSNFVVAVENIDSILARENPDWPEEQARIASESIALWESTPLTHEDAELGVNDQELRPSAVFTD